MMDTRDFVLKAFRKIYRTVTNAKFEAEGNKYTNTNDANDRIYRLLCSDKPCMIARFGTTEIGILTNYLTVHGKDSLLRKCYDYITDNTGMPWWDKLYLEKCGWASGIFPPTVETLEKFSERYFEDVPLIDLIGSFNYTEKFMPLSKNVQKVHLECLYPFFAKNPWTRALKGKKVLVVHPFIESIRYQYERRKSLFSNPDILPDYELLTLKAVQSGGGNTVNYKDWFEALNYMESEVNKINFDVSIIGCGAYGLPLAAHIKRLGKKALHLGGGTQLLFGIRGKRWEDPHYFEKIVGYGAYVNLFNDYWIRPNSNERPKNAEIVEGACYW